MLAVSITPPYGVCPSSFRRFTAPASVLSALADIAAAVSGGDLTPAEADAISRLLERYLRTLEHVDLEQRIAKLEREVPAANGSQDGQTGPDGHNGHNGHDSQASQGAQRHQLDPDSPYNFGDAP